MAWTLELVVRPVSICKISQEWNTNYNYGPVTVFDRGVSTVEFGNQYITTATYKRKHVFTHMFFDLRPLNAPVATVRWLRLNLYSTRYDNHSSLAYPIVSAHSYALYGMRWGESELSEWNRLKSSYFNDYWNLHGPGNKPPTVFSSRAYLGYRSEQFPPELSAEKSLYVVGPSFVGSLRKVALPHMNSTFGDSWTNYYMKLWQWPEVISMFCGTSFQEGTSYVGNYRAATFTNPSLSMNVEQLNISSVFPHKRMRSLSGKLTNQFEQAILDYLITGSTSALEQLAPAKVMLAQSVSYDESSQSVANVISSAPLSLSFSNANVAVGHVLFESVPPLTPSGYIIATSTNIPIAYGMLDHVEVAELMRRGTLTVELALTGSSFTDVGAYAVLLPVVSGGLISLASQRKLGLYAGSTKLAEIPMPAFKRVGSTMFVNQDDVVFSPTVASVATHVSVEADGNVLAKVPLREPIQVVEGISVAIRSGHLLVSVS